MKKLRRKFASCLAGSTLSALLLALIRALWKSMRVTCVGGDIIPSFTARGEGFIGTSWHGRMLMIPFIYPGRNLHILISIHRDGEIIANVMKGFGYNLVRGSSSKGGLGAFREMVALLKQGSDLGITPDGPKGPVEVVKEGVAQLARLSGKAVIPIAFSSSRYIRCTSWDRFYLPLPFSRMVFVVGEPLYYMSDEDIESFRVRIQAALTDVTARADNFFNI